MNRQPLLDIGPADCLGYQTSASLLQAGGSPIGGQVDVKLCGCERGVFTYRPEWSGKMNAARQTERFATCESVARVW